MVKKTTDGEVSRLGHVIKRAEQALISRKSQVLREFELTVPQYVALYTLSQFSEMSAAQLARECQVTPQTMSTVLSNLVGKGLIERTPSDLHQKVLVTRLTRTGRTVLKKADQAALGVEQVLTDSFTAAELSHFRDYLERAVKALES
ncbi:MarR family winged helix-turn-helix transcriptional regulator [Streptomyces cellulosae]|uniref:MarR family winged helix-turn-helix transcriptional regulator n=1 Tax=Streptomyces cellulosae TaxID=1968 RepID=UPI0004C75F9A|nr:MarR family transcriptional regulator [Streptomyces cellulosae]